MDFCQPCREHYGLTRPVYKVVAGTRMCRPCFSGKGTKKEMAGPLAPVTTGSRYYQKGMDRQSLAPLRYRDWNREQVAAANRLYYQTHREQVAAAQRRYREQNREQMAARHRRYAEQNPEEAAARQRRCRERKRLRAELETK